MGKHVLVTGAKGQLGSELHYLSTHKQFKVHTYYFTDRTTLDITSQSAIEYFCIKNNIDTIINCAAYTAVDKAEEDTSVANEINHLAVKQMADVAKSRNIKLIHISTDYVFNGLGHKPYKEEDRVEPQGIYGQTKLDGENALIAINPLNALIIRTSWVYSSFGNNFVKTMLRLGNERDELGVISDQVGTPTYARDLAAAILSIITNEEAYKSDKVAIYHYSNEGVASWYDFAKAIFEYANVECKVNAITTEEYPTLAKRPYYSVQSKVKIKKDFGVQIPYWRDSLKLALEVLEDN